MARTVLIVDDHPSFRASARHVLGDAGFVLLDVQLPDFDGFDVAACLTGRDDGPAVVLTFSRDGSGFGGMVARSGARGFVPKDELSGPALKALLG